MQQFRIEDYGIIKIDARRKSFNAHCWCISNPDHRLPTMPVRRLNRAASKRPLGIWFVDSMVTSGLLLLRPRRAPGVGQHHY
eukprot:8882829-Lingulodinium_polyedra.AAC.1